MSAMTKDSITRTVTAELDSISGAYTVHVTPVGVTPQWVVEIVRPETILCAGCGEQVTMTGPVAFIDAHSGDQVGTWDHQHGCGAWNTPDAERFEWRLDDTISELRVRARDAVTELASRA